MGIDIYAEWDGMTEADKGAQITGCSVEHGHVGYLREAYHGEPYATKVLVVAEARERQVYGTTDSAQIDRVLKSYRDFVALCARKETETGEPCLIIASY